MLNSLTPLFTLLLGVLLFRAKTRLVNAAGIMIGFIGAIGLLMVGESADMNNNLLFGLYVVIATLCYALSVNIIKKELNDVNSITATVWAMMFIGPLAGIYLFGFTDFTTRLATNPQALHSLGFVSILAIFGTAISVIIFNVLIRNTNALFASSVTYLIPVVAMGWGVLDGENVQVYHFFMDCADPGRCLSCEQEAEGKGVNRNSLIKAVILVPIAIRMDLDLINVLQGVDSGF